MLNCVDGLPTNV